jgi:hypothetical protein
MTDRLSDLLARRAQQGSAVHPTREGVEAALTRRASRRRRQRVVAGGIGTAVVLLSVGVGLAASGGSSGDDPRSGIAMEPGAPNDLPLVGIDLVGYVRAPGLDPDPTPTEDDLTYAVFTGDEVDVLGPMVTVTLQEGDLDPGGTPIDLDGDGDTRGEGDGWQGIYPGGSTVSWSLGGEIVAVSGHSGVSTEDVVQYARELVGQPIDLEEIPTPERLPNREVVTFGPLPDFASRTSSYQGPGNVVHVLTTRDPGYFDLTRIVSTEGRQYERIGFDSSVLGPGEAILSPDDDGTTSALIRTDAGLTIHVFGPGVVADTLRTAIEQDHLVDLTTQEDPSPVTTTPAPASTAAPTTVAGDATITDIRWGTHDTGERIVIEFAEALPTTHEVLLSDEPSAGECVRPETSGVAFVNVHLGLTKTTGDDGQFSAIGLGDPVVSLQVACEFEAFVDLVIALDRPVEPVITELADPARLVIDIPH